MNNVIGRTLRVGVEYKSLVEKYYGSYDGRKDKFNELFCRKFFPSYEFKSDMPLSENSYQSSYDLWRIHGEIRHCIVIYSNGIRYDLLFCCDYKVKTINNYLITHIDKNGVYSTDNPIFDNVYEFIQYMDNNIENMYSFIRQMYHDMYETNNLIYKSIYLFLWARPYNIPRDIAKMIIKKILF
jgi:hypothetical protein